MKDFLYLSCIVSFLLVGVIPSTWTYLLFMFVIAASVLIEEFYV